MGISLSHILLVGIVVLLVFGAGRLPTLMKDLAKGLRAFKDGLKEEDPKAKAKAKPKPKSKPKARK